MAQDMMDITRLSIPELLKLYAKILEKLRDRGAIRSGNLVGDYAEYLFCRAFGWQQLGNSERDIDALDEDGTRYRSKDGAQPSAIARANWGRSAG